LVKTALYGEDANWGRILAAAGSIPLLPSSSFPLHPHPTIDPTKVSVTFIPSDGSPPLPVLVNGEPETVDETRAAEILKREEFELVVDLGLGGQGEAKYWTCDFSYVSFSCWSLGRLCKRHLQEYVRINGDYRT
jgi:glutamate N-acetyltransferase/amino-acid N-acetyltransferase